MDLLKREVGLGEHTANLHREVIKEVSGFFRVHGVLKQ